MLPASIYTAVVIVGEYHSLPFSSKLLGSVICTSAKLSLSASVYARGFSKLAALKWITSPVRPALVISATTGGVLILIVTVLSSFAY
ncbi:hypothetical protein D3C73_1284270 [compost metagenome]